MLQLDSFLIYTFKNSDEMIHMHLSPRYDDLISIVIKLDEEITFHKRNYKHDKHAYEDI